LLGHAFHVSVQTLSHASYVNTPPYLAGSSIGDLVRPAQIGDSMNVKFNFATLKETKWHEYVVRFIFGGLITVATGIIAKKFGPGIGGLFLAFPAIFPASATLVEGREKEKKQRVGMQGVNRGRDAASLDARGAAMGSVGLIVFAVIVWRFLAAHTAWLVLAGATLAWLLVAVVLWNLRKAVRGFLFSR
jgi:hypothetical protein